MRDKSANYDNLLAIDTESYTKDLSLGKNRFPQDKPVTAQYKQTRKDEGIVVVSCRVTKIIQDRFNLKGVSNQQ